MASSDGRMTDDEIAERIRAGELEVEYLRELLRSLDADPALGFTPANLAALDAATPEQRRRAALRTLGVDDA